MSKQWHGSAAAIRAYHEGCGIRPEEGWYLLERLSYYGPTHSIAVVDHVSGYLPLSVALDRLEVSPEHEGEWSWGCRNLASNEYAKSLAVAYYTPGKPLRCWRSIYGD
jgi:hypothetical protein